MLRAKLFFKFFVQFLTRRFLVLACSQRYSRIPVAPAGTDDATQLQRPQVSLNVWHNRQILFHIPQARLNLALKSLRALRHMDTWTKLAHTLNFFCYLCFQKHTRAYTCVRMCITGAIALQKQCLNKIPTQDRCKQTRAQRHALYKLPSLHKTKPKKGFPFKPTGGQDGTLGTRRGSLNSSTKNKVYTNLMSEFRKSDLFY